MMRIFTLLLGVMIIGSLNAQTIVCGGPGDANAEFDGGLNDWTVNSVAPNDSALWVWEADGWADRGAYSTNITPIESPSVANGAAVFDSDFYDNRGCTNDEGQPISKGQAIATQIGELVSPVFSTVGSADVSLTWYQYTRKFNASNIYAVEVTNDGGATWTSYSLDKNNTLVTNTGTAADDFYIVNISDSAGDQAEVQFKFVYNANYYFWVIDDVAVIETPDVDLVMSNMYYPMGAYSTPASMVNADTLDFAAELLNEGGATQSGGTITASILDAAGTAVHTLSQDFGEIAPGDTLFIVFDDRILPEDINLQEGVYTVEYEAVSNDGEDAAPGNNGLAEEIIISTDSYSINNGVSTANSFDGGDFTAVMVMRTGDLPDGMEYVANTITTGGASNGGLIANAGYNISVLKVKNQIGEELDGVFDDINFGDPNGDEHPNLDFVGYSFNTIEGGANFEANTTELFEAENDDLGIILEENTTYLFGVKWDFADDPGGLVFVNSGSNIYYYQNISIVHLNTGWFTIDPTLAWQLATNVTTRIVDGVELVEMEEGAVSVYPNPAAEFTAVELDFETPTSASIIMRNVNGSYITSKSVENVTNEKVEFQVSNLPAGAYSFEIVTSDNARTVKTFVITK